MKQNWTRLVTHLNSPGPKLATRAFGLTSCSTRIDGLEDRPQYAAQITGHGP